MDFIDREFFINEKLQPTDWGIYAPRVHEKFVTLSNGQTVELEEFFSPQGTKSILVKPLKDETVTNRMKKERISSNNNQQVQLNGTLVVVNLDASELFTSLIGGIQALSLSYQNIHWTAIGSSFYENHLLFERLYSQTSADFDELAEKSVAYFGGKTVEIEKILLYTLRYLSDWKKICDPLAKVLAAEKVIQKTIQNIYNQLKKYELLTLGMDDFLMSLSHQHDQNVYLLQQVAK